jgi:hypothetical protein
MKSSSKRPSLLSRSTKAKLSAAALAVTTLFTGLGMTSCNNGTSPIPEVPQSHPDNIGYINGVDIRVPASAGLIAEQKADLLIRLTTAMNLDPIANHANIDLLKIVEITGFNEAISRENLNGGILRGIVHPTGGLSGWLMGALEEGWAMAYNSKTNTIHIAGSARVNQRG